MTAAEDAPLARALCSLEGLSIGDAFGERYFAGGAEQYIASRTLAHPPWHFTDDTQMALSIVAVLRQHGTIEQDALAASFSKHYEEERGYGDAMNRLVPMIYLSGMWRMMAPRLFSGEGSFGNGAAMRVAPIGAYFSDDMEAVVENAARSAEVTHAHPEAAAGAIAVAVATAHACRLRGKTPPTLPEFLDAILPHVPDSEVRQGIEAARGLPAGTTATQAVRALGSGDGISAHDTVPFVLWCAGQHLDNYEEALWLTVSGLGDRDTTCAMVGGIVACRVGIAGIPEAWRQAREPLPTWPLHEQNELF